jgi:hypothetical protein
MGSATRLDDEDVGICDDDLRAIQSQLETLVRAPKDYPLECSLGTCEFLFEARDDVEILLESLTCTESDRTTSAP